MAPTCLSGLSRILKRGLFADAFDGYTPLGIGTRIAHRSLTTMPRYQLRYLNQVGVTEVIDAHDPDEAEDLARLRLLFTSLGSPLRSSPTAGSFAGSSSNLTPTTADRDRLPMTR